MARRFSVEAVFKAVDKMTEPVTRMQNRVNKFTRSTRRGFYQLNRTVDGFTSSIKRSALAVTAALAVSSGAMANVVSTGAEFEQSLVNAAARFPGEIRRGTEAFAELEEAARRTGATTEFTASQSAESLNFLAMAGFNAESSIAALPGVVNLATAAQVDLATATDVASDALGSFNLMSKDASQLGANLARVNDVISKTTTTANTTVETLFETIKDGAPVATSAGASMETFAALAGELANAGIKGTRAGTTLKNMFLSLSAPSSKASKILGRLGIVTSDADGNMRDIVDILGDLNQAMDGLGTAQRAGVLEGIFGKIPIAGVNVLLASGTERLRDYRKELEAASGASSDMADVMRDTLQGRLKTLNSAIESVKISTFALASGPLADAVDKVTEWVRANEQLISTNISGFLVKVIDNFENIVKWAKRIAIGIGSFIALSMVLKTIAGVLAVINLLAAANPLVLVIMAAVAAVALLATQWGKLKAEFSRFISDFKKEFAPIISFFEKIFETISKAAQAVGGFLGISGEQKTPEERRQLRGQRAAPQVITPQERISRTIQESRETSAAEVTIRDETGRAEVTRGRMGRGLKLEPSGAF